MITDSTLVTQEMFLRELEGQLDRSGLRDHTFLLEFERSRLDLSALQRFAIQWYKAARAHKIAFPVIVSRTLDDDVRFELIEILYDEYGKGDREKIHARLLMRFLGRLGISAEDVENAMALGGVARFSEEVMRVWSTADPVFAFGLHFSLEYLAAPLHAHFARGLRKYDFLSEHDREYFEYHEVAEQNHSDYSELGVLIYAQTDGGRERMRQGAALGIELMRNLWEDFGLHVFGVDFKPDRVAEAEVRAVA